MADRTAPPFEVEPPPSPRKYWTRRGAAEWLEERLAADPPMLVGIDHGFSFPLVYFKENELPFDWTAFLDDFQLHWPTDQDNIYVDFIRNGTWGNAAARSGSRQWRRLTEVRAGGAKSVFHFDVQGSVAKSTHAGLPWLSAFFDGRPLAGFISGRSTAGSSRLADRWWQRCIRPFGIGVSRGRVVNHINTGRVAVREKPEARS